MNREAYHAKVEALRKQSQFVDSLGHHYKKVDGRLWVLKYYRSTYSGPMVAWSKLEGRDIPKLLLPT